MHYKLIYNAKTNQNIFQISKKKIKNIVNLVIKIKIKIGTIIK